MRDSTIARNYAEALLALAEKAGNREGWGTLVREVADAMARDEKLRRFLESPRVSEDEKSRILGRAFQDRMPRLFVRYLQTLVAKRRQMLIPQIATEYFTLLDEAEGRVHAMVTVARPVADADRDRLAAQLTKVVGRRVVPHVTVNPAILGGVVVRIGDTVMDGSVRSRLARLRGRMLAGAGR